MEQATNTFNKGLQMDTNPMILGNDTLTDCLNGTLITMDGNEVILQNDMGNRRVNNAFLPAGYEPVGIKEYGGIIYVAAYNPITNKSQIGSFPSPKRRYNNVNGSCNVGDFGSVEYGDFGSIPFLKSNVLLFPFEIDTNDLGLNNSKQKVKMHPGDKFVVVGENLSEEYYTNYNNICPENDKLLLTPKNKLYTLSLGVLNSQNEFVDITSTLLRYNNSGNNSSIYSFSDDTLDYIKFNTGYFIPKNCKSEIINMPIADENFEKNRLTYELNTYAYKLIGPLYLKKELNIILDFTYNIYGNKCDNTNNNGRTAEYELYIETFYEYNCPDGINDGAGGNDKYYTFDEGDPADLGAYINTSVSNLLTISDNYGLNDLRTDITIDNSFYNSKYDEKTNTYKVKKLAHLDILSSDIIDNNVNLYLVPLTPNLDSESGLYYGIKNLSYIENIDVTKLNSNTIEVTDFRFYTNFDLNSMNILVGLRAYPKYGEEFKDLKVTIYKYYYENTPFYPDTGINLENYKVKVFDWEGGYSGRRTFIWNYSEEQKSHHYVVRISYTDSSNTVINIDKWVMTTKLFNDCYYELNNEDFVRDYCEAATSLELEHNPIKDRLNVNLYFNLEYFINNDDYKLLKGGDLKSFKFNFLTIRSYEYLVDSKVINIKGKLDLDRTLYPLELQLNNSRLTGTFTGFDPSGNNDYFIALPDGTKFYPGDELVVTGMNVNDPTQDLYLTTYDKYRFVNPTINNNITINNGTIEIKYITDFIAKSSLIQAVKDNLETILIRNLFLSVFENNFLDSDRGAAIYAYTRATELEAQYGLKLSVDHSASTDSGNTAFRKNADNDHIASAPYGVNSETVISSNNLGVYGELYSTKSESKHEFYFLDSEDDINKGINQKLGNKLFIFGVNNNEYCYKGHLVENSDKRATFALPILIWMKTLEGWALMPLKLRTDSNYSYGLGKFNILYGVIDGSLGSTYLTIKYLEEEGFLDFVKSRIKDFYYIAKKNYSIGIYPADPSLKYEIWDASTTLNIKIDFTLSSRAQGIDDFSSNIRYNNNNSLLFSKINIQKYEILNINIDLTKFNLFKEFIEILYNKINYLDYLLLYKSGSLDAYLTEDKYGFEFANNMLYTVNQDNNYNYFAEPLSTGVEYLGGLPMVHAQNRNCNIDYFRSRTHDDDNPIAYLHMGVVPTIPSDLLLQ